MKTKSKFIPQPPAVVSAFVLALSLACLPAGRAQAQAVTNTPVPGAIRFDSVAEASNCEIEGTSTMGHDWLMKTPQLIGSMEVDEGFPESALANPAAAKPPVRIRIALRTFRSEKAAMDEKMQTCMDVVKYPNIEYRVIELKPKSPAGTKGAIQFDATGTLTIYGKTLTNSMPVTIEKKDGKIKVVGNTVVKMSDHGIPQCSFLNALTVGDVVKVKIEWVSAPKAKSQP